jgi:hypothetical protein
MKATNVFLELGQSKECEKIAKSQDISDYPAHVELKVLDSVYLSKNFNLSKFCDGPLLRISLPDLDLPIKGNLTAVVKLFIHHFEQVSLLGLQDLPLNNKKFPLTSEFPIISKHTSERIYNLKINLGSYEQVKEEVYARKYQIGALEFPSQPYLRTVIAEKASKIACSTEEKNGAKSVQHLLHGVALAFLKATRDTFMFTEPTRHLISDEFHTMMLSRDYHFVHSPDSNISKNIFMDLGQKKMVVMKASAQTNIPKVYHSAMVLLPNGKYIMAGGNSKDGVVSHHGVYYFDPLLGDYTKISEIPFNLHKHEMHYNNGQIAIFGGIDMKDDKGGHNSESTNFASTFYTFNLSTKLWTKGEKMTQKSNDRCPSILYKGQYLVNRGTDTCESLIPGSGPWKSLKVINKEKNSSMIMHQPSVFFVVNDQIHICYKKTKEDLNTYSIARIGLTDKNVEVNHIIDTDLTSLSGIKVMRNHEDDGLVEKVFIYDQVDLRLFVFKNGIHDQKNSPTDKVKINLIIDHSLNVQNIGKSAENCGASLVSELDRYLEMKIESVPAVIGETIKDQSLIRIHNGIGHCFVPLSTGNTVLLGYFEKISEELYRPVCEAFTLRANAWGSTTVPVLPIPSKILSTVGHASLKVKGVIFIVGGLQVVDSEVTLTASEIDKLGPKAGALVPSRQILSYRPSNHTWKTIDLLPEGLFNCQISYHKNKIYIFGGLNEAGTFNKKIWYLNLETYTLVDTGLAIDLELDQHHSLRVLSLGKYIVIGSDCQNRNIVFSIEEKRTYICDL